MLLNLGVTGAKRSSYAKHNPRSIVAAIMEERPTAGLEEVQSEFHKRLRDDDNYEEYCITLENYFVANAFESLIGERERNKKAPHRAEARAQARAATKATLANTREKLQEHIAKEATVLLLEVIMPNGKPLRQCSGADCRRAGGWYEMIAKRIGDKKIVGDVLSEGQLREMWAKVKS